MGRPKGSGANTLEQTERKFVEVAIELFSRKGFKETSIRDIAQAMGMTTANLYHHFGSKEGLVHAVEKLSIKPVLEELQGIAALDLPPLECLTSMLRAHLTYMGTYRNRGMISFLSQVVSSFDKGDSMTTIYSEKMEIFFLYRRVMERLLTSTGKTGEPAIAALSAFGVINWFLLWYRPEGRLSMEAVIEYLIAFILHGFIGDGPHTGGPGASGRTRRVTGPTQKRQQHKIDRRNT